MTDKQKKLITYIIRENWGKPLPIYPIPDELIPDLKKIFIGIYKSVIISRGNNPEISEKELQIIRHIFNWIIFSPEFKGDLQKGIYLTSAQGFGKDILMTTIIEFLGLFDRNFRRFTFPDFCTTWFEKVPAYFNGPIAINDIDEHAKMKRERESIPILELLNYREQINSRRGLIVSTNYLPEVLQEAIEKGRPVKKLNQRIIECFNVIKIRDAESKRRESKIEF